MKVHHITPGRADKNLGGAINEIIKRLPNQDWICIRDIDSMPGYHEKFFEQCEYFARYSGYDLIGCMTNRCGMKEQLLSGDRDKIDHNTDLLHHREVARDLYNQHKYKIKPAETTIAGLMMLFPKSVWEAVGGFKEGTIRVNGSFVDWHFCNDVKNAGYRIGIARGLYMIHLYRIEHKNPRSKTNHLEK